MTSLLKYDAACRAIAEAKSVDEVKDVHDKAEAMRLYGRMAKDTQLEADAAEIRLRAERRLGEMLVDAKAAGQIGEGRPKKTVGDTDSFERISLSEAGIDRDLSSRAQKVAGIAAAAFEAAVARKREEILRGGRRVALDIIKEQRRAQERDAFAARVARGCSVTDLEDLARTGQRFGAIYADPPWSFEVWSGEGKDRSADNHYQTGGLESIKALPVEALAAEDCALFMWAVMPELPGALEVIKAWGFTYKTVAFTWMKQNKSGEGLFLGMGYWTRANAEICLLATRGKPKRLDMGVPQALLAPVAAHSRKPDEIAERIMRLVGGPYLELYARRPREGWTTWGNEIPREQFLAPVDAAGAPVQHDSSTGEIIEDDTLEIPSFLRRAQSEANA